jgi:hypothetical protein
MKTKLHFLRALFVILAIAICGAALNARANFTANVSVNYAGLSPYNYFSEQTITNVTGDVNASLHLEGMLSSDGGYTYYDLHRYVVGGAKYYTLHIAGSAFIADFQPPIYSYAHAEGGVSLVEDMMIEYLPDSVTDTPPTSVSFQVSYLVQGYLQIEAGGGNWEATASPQGLNVEGNPSGTADVTIPLTTNIVSTVFNESLNRPFQIPFHLYAVVNWDNAGEPLSSSAAAYDLQHIFQGYVNIVDQNGQPIPPSKLLFLCVNPNAPNDPTQQLVSPTTPDLTIEEAVSLQAIPGSNSLVLQWPAYASNYQLQTSTNLLTFSWTTNSLPAPVQSGPFLQVIIPTTNGCAFFRLQSQ